MLKVPLVAKKKISNLLKFFHFIYFYLFYFFSSSNFSPPGIFVSFLKKKNSFLRLRTLHYSHLCLEILFREKSIIIPVFMREHMKQAKMQPKTLKVCVSDQKYSKIKSTSEEGVAWDVGDSCDCRRKLEFNC